MIDKVEIQREGQDSWTVRAYCAGKVCDEWNVAGGAALIDVLKSVRVTQALPAWAYEVYNYVQAGDSWVGTAPTQEGW